MLKVKGLAIIIATFIYFSSCTAKKEDKSVSLKLKIIPTPNKVLMRDGELNLNNDFWVIANVGEQSTADLAKVLVIGLEGLTSRNIGISDLYSTRKHNQSIKIEVQKNYYTDSEEAYTLDITSKHINITAGTSEGVYYGIESMLQILRSTVSEDGFKTPKMILKDMPKYKIRGVILNPAGYSSEDIQSIVSTMTRYKLNSIYTLGNNNNNEHILKVIEGKPVGLNVISTRPNNLTVLSYGDSKEELLNAFAANNNSIATEGYLLDLTSSTSGNITLRLKLLSEIAWSEKENSDFSGIIE